MLIHNRLFGSIIIRISYGFEDPEYNKGLVKQAETLASGFSESIMPGRFLVNVFPLLRHVPSWLPGAGFKSHIESLAVLSDDTLKVYDEVKDSLVSELTFLCKYRILTREQRTGKRVVGPSLAAGLIEDLPDEKDPNRPAQEAIARNTSALSYIGT